MHIYTWHVDFLFIISLKKYSIRQAQAMKCMQQNKEKMASYYNTKFSLMRLIYSIATDDDTRKYTQEIDSNRSCPLGEICKEFASG
jgi:hypothetical protein